jgi:endoglucanase
MVARVYALLAAAVVAASVPGTVVRSGGPSAPADPKVAIVASQQKLAGERFRVVNGRGRTVLRGRLKRVAGNSDPWKHAAAADWSRVKAPGSYRIKARGASSRAWQVTSADQVTGLLRIYAVNADGNEPNPVFGPAHLNDATLKGGGRLDLTGGWRDAGDNLKFTQTIAQSVAYLHLAARLAPAQAPQLQQTAAIGVRYLRKAHPQGNLWIALVGDERDHSTGFRDPAADDANTEQGVGIRYAYPTDSSTILGEGAAALALAGEVQLAEQWYKQAVKTNAEVDIQDPNVPDFYPEDFFHDDLAFAATALYRATGDMKYLADAGEQLRAGDENELYGGITVGAPRALVAADLCGGLGAPAAPDEAIRTLACDDVRKTMDAIRARARERAFGSPGIYTFGFIQDNNAAGALAAAAYRAGVADDGLRIAAAARDYLRGRNQWGRSFVVGTRPFEAHQPHHSAFLKGKPAELLAGAVVGGPVKGSDVTGAGLPAARNRFNGAGIVYEDKRADFVTSEVGLGYSAPAVLLAASLGSP